MRGGFFTRSRFTVNVTLIAIVSVALVLGFGGPLVKPLDAQAGYGTGSATTPDPKSQYIDIVNWVDFNQVSALMKRYKPTPRTDGSAGRIENADLPVSVSSTTQIGEAQMITTCTVSQLRRLGGTTPASSFQTVDFHWPGGWISDGFDEYYGDQQLTGIGSAGGEFNFDVSCDVKLKTGPAAEPVEIPVQGLVFANAESLDNEKIAIQPSSSTGQDLTWRLLEYENQCGPRRGTTQLGVDASNTLTMTSNQSYCRDGLFSFTNMFAEGADSAWIHMALTRGGNYLAIGVVAAYDSGDAPLSYGEAGAIFQPVVSGGAIEPNTSLKNADAIPQATVRYASSPVLGALAPDGDMSNMQADNSWYDLAGDDRNGWPGRNDEDALAEPVVVPALAATYQHTFPCSSNTSPTYVAGWLDWNGDGTFTASERSSGQCVDGKAVLEWDVTDAMLPTDRTPGVLGSALRLMISTTEINEANGITDSGLGVLQNGEVEDHAVTIVKPGFTVTKETLDAAGVATPAAGWEFTAAAAQGAPLLAEVSATNPGGNAVGTLTQTTAAGATTLHFPLTFAQVDPATPVPLTNAAASFANVSADIKIDEATQPGYLLFEQNGAAATGALRDRAATGLADASVYGYPDMVMPTWVGNNTDAQTGHGSGFTLRDFTPLTVADYTVRNQPTGGFEVTPAVDTSQVELSPGEAVDPNLTFEGTWQCTPPASFTGPTGTDATQPQVVTGTWGPVAAGATATVIGDGAATPKIPLGSVCTVTQTQRASTSPGNETNSAPIAGATQYTWGETTYAPQEVTAKNVALGQQLDAVTVTNPVVDSPVTDVTFTKVNPEGATLQGATFQLTGPAGFDSRAISDCTASPCDPTLGDINPAPGVYTIEGLPVGEYTLAETNAPAGYDSQRMKFRGAAGDYAASVTFGVVVDDLTNPAGKTLADLENARLPLAGLPGLPMSGGLGEDAFKVLGGILVLFAAGVGLYAGWRRRNGGLADGRVGL